MFDHIPAVEHPSPSSSHPCLGSFWHFAACVLTHFHAEDKRCGKHHLHDSLPAVCLVTLSKSEFIDLPQ